jgi:hypothetical protein
LAPTSFTSPLYGYSLTVPTGWSNTPATKVWDGTGSSSGDPSNDRWGSAGDSMWGHTEPFTGDRGAFADEQVAATVEFHSDTCPDPPEVTEEVTIGGQPGTFLAWDCGILINEAVTVRDGVGYLFGYRDPGVHAATDPADRAIFLELLNSLRFPS